MGWDNQIKTRHYTCRYHGDLTERLSSYSRQMDISYCPDCGTALLVQVVGGDNMTKSKKLKVMTEVKNDAPKLREAKGEAKSEEIKVPLAVQVKYLKPVKAKKVKEVKEHVEAKPDPELDRALEALRKLGKVGTPELVKELGYTGESRRDRVRRLMDRLHDKGLIHRTHEGKHYVYEAKETTTQQTATVETIKEVAA